jgi:hypothetical protein
MANPDVLMVSEEKIKSYTNLNTNLSPEDLTPYVWDAQNITIPNLIGGTYYQALKARIIAGTLTTADEYLLDNFIGPVLCNYGFYYATTFIQYRSYNKGILKGTSEQSETLDLDELKFMQSQIKNIAEAYAAQMVQYLCTHSNDYPEYNAANAKDGQMPDRMSPFQSGLVVPHIPYARNQRWARGLNNGSGYYPGWGCGYDLPNSY